MASTSFGIQKEHLCVLSLLAQTVKEAGPAGIPSGHLYAIVMSKMQLGSYSSAIEHLKKLNVISEDAAHVLRWIEVRDADENVPDA